MPLLIIILLTIVAYYIFFISQFVNIVFKGYAPLISTDFKTIKAIIQEISIKKQTVIYELGCGRARFLRIIEKNFPSTELIGIENLLSLYLVVKFKLKLQGSKIKLLKKDFFTVDLKTADLIYCYLNNATMLRLGEVFRRDCQPGTQIISRCFPIPQFKPEKVLKTKSGRVYFYKI